ncbi:unnamed protein product [Lampetra planeri]
MELVQPAVVAVEVALLLPVLVLLLLLALVEEEQVEQAVAVVMVMVALLLVTLVVPVVQVTLLLLLLAKVTSALQVPQPPLLLLLLLLLKMRVASTAKSGPDHGYDVCFNFLRHAFDTLLLFFLGLCSPALRVILDVLGLGGGVFKYGLYGMAIFLVSVYGLSFVFTLMRTYIVETSIVFAVLQCLVLAVSLRNSDC